MTDHLHNQVRAFFNAIAQGELPDELASANMTAWTLTSGDSDRARFIGGIQLLAKAFDGTLQYQIQSLVAEGNKAIAEVTSSGQLSDGTFSNVHVFVFEFADGLIVSMREYMDPQIVATRVVPAIQRVLEA